MGAKKASSLETAKANSKLDLGPHQPAVDKSVDPDCAPLSLSLVPVMLGVRFRRFDGVVLGVVRVAVGGVGMVRGLFVIAGFVMFGGFLVMVSRFFVVFSGLVMMFCCFFGHSGNPPHRPNN